MFVGLIAFCSRQYSVSGDRREATTTLKISLAADIITTMALFLLGILGATGVLSLSAAAAWGCLGAGIAFGITTLINQGHCIRATRQPSRKLQL